ncbi:mitochondrial ribosomal protein L27-domain-containing protein [Baffinella frigidus]|nr:mitochondrial ribosomal protein L27-domain-containing protein [Cryptophyta sp. CCMP2293]
MDTIAATLRGKYGNRYGATKGATPITAKRGPRDFYKGKGAPSTGRLTSKGHFILQEKKLKEFMVPDLTGCDLRPYVSYTTHKKDSALPATAE